MHEGPGPGSSVSSNPAPPSPHDPTSMATWDSDLKHASPLASDAIPGYRIVREVHRGGQGVVYQALQLATRRNVAIKVMRSGPFAGNDDRVRFEREMQILALLEHDNIVTIHHGGAAAGHDYFAMDYVDGQTLDRHVA